jgi:hypothetical protein
VPHDLRDQVVDFVRRWSDKTEIPAARLVSWAGLGRSKFFDWKSRYGKVNEHNGWIPRDHWLEDWEEKAIILKTAVEKAGQGCAALILLGDATPNSTYRSSPAG